MYNQKITIKKPKALRIFLSILTAVLFLVTLLFIPTFSSDSDSRMMVILFAPMTVLMGLFTLSQWCWKFEFEGRQCLYINGLLIKKEFHISQISTASVYDPKGLTAYDREQKQLFFIPSHSKYFVGLLVHLKQQGTAIQFVTPDSLLEKLMEHKINGTEIQDWPTNKNYYKEKIPTDLKQLQRLNMAGSVILAIVVFVLPILAVRSSGNFVRSLFISGIFLLIGIKIIMNMLVSEFLRRKIRKNSRKLPARIVELSGRQGKLVTPLFEFEDENGLHCLPGFDNIKVARKSEAEKFGEEHHIYYNPEYATLVLDADTPGAKASTLIVPSVMTGIFLFISMLIFGSSFLLWRSPEQIEGDKIRVWTAESYKKSDLTQADVDSDTVQWICSTYAIYTELNNKDLRKIGGAKESDESIKGPIRIQLEDGWDITDRSSAISQIDTLLTGGQRKKYRGLIDSLKEKKLLSLSRDEFIEKFQLSEDRYRYLTAYDVYKLYGEHGIDAWDYCRALQVLGDCYQAEYINLEECLDQSLAIAKKLQEQFKSWDELTDSYLYGYQFWGNEDPDSGYSDTIYRRQIYEDLQATVEGPYSLPYDTELKDTWKGVKGSQKASSEDTDKEPETSEVKPDTDGYYAVKYYYNKGRTLVKPPEGFEISPYSSDTWLSFKSTRIEKPASAEIQVSIEEIMPDSQEYKKKSVKETAAFILEDTSNIDFHDIQETEIDGTKINYIYYNYDLLNFKNKKWELWWSEDGKYTISVEVSENTVALDQTFVFDDSTVVQTVFDCVKR